MFNICHIYVDDEWCWCWWQSHKPLSICNFDVENLSYLGESCWWCVMIYHRWDVLLKHTGHGPMWLEKSCAMFGAPFLIDHINEPSAQIGHIRKHPASAFPHFCVHIKSTSSRFGWLNKYLGSDCCACVHPFLIKACKNWSKPAEIKLQVVQGHEIHKGFLKANTFFYTKRSSQWRVR